MAMTNNEQVFPKYFSCDFFQKSLALDTQVTDFEVKPAVGKGDNYTSTIYRVRLNLKNGDTKSLIIKCCEADGKMKEMLDEFGMFGRESLTLSKFISGVRKLLESVGIQYDDTKLSPE